MRDWKGNKVSVGDTVIVIETYVPERELMGCWLDMGSSRGSEVKTYGKIPAKYGWREVGRYDIVELGGRTYMDMGGVKVEVLPGRLDLETTCFRSENIICIEGVSDNQGEYYLDYFKV